jgi:hypothetical protein
MDGLPSTPDAVANNRRGRNRNNLNSDITLSRSNDRLDGESSASSPSRYYRRGKHQQQTGARGDHTPNKYTSIVNSLSLSPQSLYGIQSLQ